MDEALRCGFLSLVEATELPLIQMATICIAKRLEKDGETEAMMQKVTKTLRLGPATPWTWLGG